MFVNRHDDVMSLLGRDRPLYTNEWLAPAASPLGKWLDAHSVKAILIVGAAGSIGAATALELANFGNIELFLVDIDENRLAELVRNIRSDALKCETHFHSIVCDALSDEMDIFLRSHKFDLICNFAALKHVRSDGDPITMRRMLKVNVQLPIKLAQYAQRHDSYLFNVSTDKASAPANFMGATKNLMEIALSDTYGSVALRFARFANVAFSQGSLLDSLHYRLANRQPVSVPADIKRFFITDREAAYICLQSIMGTKSGEILIPSESALSPIYICEVVERYLQKSGKTPVYLETEEHARSFFEHRADNDSEWPVYRFLSNTDGEKEVEQFKSEQDRSVAFLGNRSLEVIKARKDVNVSKADDLEVELLHQLTTDAPDVDDLRSFVSRYVCDYQPIIRGRHLNAIM